MHSNTTIPHPVVVPATGAPTCAGVELRYSAGVELRYSISRLGDHYEATRALGRIAARDGYLLCLRPTADRAACVGLSPTQFADASLQPDFAARALVVDPYDAEGNDVREYPAAVNWFVTMPASGAMSGKTKFAAEMETSKARWLGLYTNGLPHTPLT